MDSLTNETAAQSMSTNSLSSQWDFLAGVTYLNHGSFGPTPRDVLESREGWLREHAANPMDFFVRRLNPLMDDAVARLARFVKCSADNLVFVPNSTAGMNIVAANLELAAGDEVLLTDHEYGAVVRIWGKVCQKVGARTTLARLPLPLTSVDEVVESIFNRVTAKTKLLVISHIASPTSVILPVREICERAREQGLMVCVDGPHALAMIDIDLNSIPCDFYTASCHKWLCAPYGSGFLYVRSRHKQGLRSNLVSWGRNLGGRAPSWKDEFEWPGTFDPTPSLTVPVAIDWLTTYGLAKFRTQTHELAKYARHRFLEIEGSEALTSDSSDWYGSMVTVRLPLTDNKTSSYLTHPLQKWLWETQKIEVPIVQWRDNVHIRVSCYLYNTRQQIDLLVSAVAEGMNEYHTSPGQD